MIICCPHRMRGNGKECGDDGVFGNGKGHSSVQKALDHKADVLLPVTRAQSQASDERCYDHGNEVDR